MLCIFWDNLGTKFLKVQFKKCFQKARFPGTQLESDGNDEDISPSIEIAPGIGFNDYVTCDDGLSICTTEVSEIGELSETMNSDSDTEIDNQTPSETVTFSNAFSRKRTFLSHESRE